MQQSKSLGLTHAILNVSRGRESSHNCAAILCKIPQTTFLPIHKSDILEFTARYFVHQYGLLGFSVFASRFFNSTRSNRVIPALTACLARISGDMRAAASDSSPSDAKTGASPRPPHATRTAWETTTAAATAKSSSGSSSIANTSVIGGTAKRKPAAPRAPRKRPKRKTRTSEVRRVRVNTRALLYIVLCVPRRSVLPLVVRCGQLHQNEIELLQKESKNLEAKVEFLKHREGVHDQQALDKQALDNALFREWLRNQQYVLAGLKSAVATDSVRVPTSLYCVMVSDLECISHRWNLVRKQSDHIPSPLSSHISLGEDLSERRAHLLAIKAQKIHDARQFLAKRTQFMDLSKPFSDVSRSQSAVDGTMCTTKLDVVPLFNATSVKQVFDTVLYYAMNVEMSTADVNGDVIVREEDDTGDESVSQNRFVFLKKEFGVQVETNNVIFCQYTPSTRPSGSRSPAASVPVPAIAPDAFPLPDTSDEGLIVVDFVDEDALYPYRPAERLGDNVTSVFSIRAYPLSALQQRTRVSPKQAGRRRSHNQDDDGNGDGESERNRESSQQQQHVVVMTRWFQAKFHPTSLLIPIDTLVDLRRDLDHVGDAVISLVRARFRPPPALAFGC